MNIPLDTILTTERLALRPVDIGDVELVWRASRVAGFNDGMTWDAPESREQIMQIIQRNLDQWLAGSDYVFTVCSRDPAIAIGRVGLHKATQPDTWTLGFWIHPDHWGKAYAPEAARAVLEFGFKELKTVRVMTEHAIWNQRSQSVIRGLGFEYVRENPAGFYKSGKPVTVLEYGLNALPV
jgi:ribosomal-protein-alanine N-acetyltransferase